MKKYEAAGELKNGLAESVRVCVAEDLLENFGHVSARDTQSGRIFMLRHLHERLDRVTAEDFIEVDLSGRQVGGKLEPPNEVFLHTAIYRKRPDVNAVVYTHPLYSTVFSVLGRKIDPLLANCTFLASGISVYDDPRSIGTLELGEKLADRLGASFGLLMRGSGLVVVAGNIEEATLLSILIEKAAKVQYMAAMIGEPRVITAEEVPDKFGNMPKHFFESSWGHYVSKANSLFGRQSNSQ